VEGAERHVGKVGYARKNLWCIIRVSAAQVIQIDLHVRVFVSAAGRTGGRAGGRGARVYVRV
jgi:hypothetical protein